MNRRTPIGAAQTLTDLRVWLENVKADEIYIPKNHPLRAIREFNPEYSETWKTFDGVKIIYE